MLWSHPDIWLWLTFPCLTFLLLLSFFNYHFSFLTLKALTFSRKKSSQLRYIQERITYEVAIVFWERGCAQHYKCFGRILGCLKLTLVLLQWIEIWDFSDCKSFVPTLKYSRFRTAGFKLPVHFLLYTLPSFLEPSHCILSCLQLKTNPQGGKKIALMGTSRDWNVKWHFYLIVTHYIYKRKTSHLKSHLSILWPNISELFPRPWKVIESIM